MALWNPVRADSLRECIRRCRLPAPLNIVLFGFDPVRPEEDGLLHSADPPPCSDCPPETPPPRRPPVPEIRRISYDEIRQKVQEWSSALEDFPDDLVLEDLAARTGLCKTHLSKYFKYELKKDFRQWKVEQKIACAMRLLESDPDAMIGTVARRAGFGNESNFFRQFRRQTGRTPAEWRRLRLGETD